MPDLAWVTLGFSLVYGAMAIYTLALEARRRRARRRVEERS